MTKSNQRRLEKIGSSGILVARFWCEKENYQAAISAPSFAGGLRNSPPFQQAEHFHEGHFPRKQHFLEGNPPAKPGAEMVHRDFQFA